jgi:site-specific recombinase XerD
MSDTKRRLPPEPLSTGEVRALLNACSNRYPTGIRNRALIAVLWRSGLRIHEALALMPKDLDEERGSIRVLHGKDDEARTVGMDPEAWAILARWLDKRRELGANGRGRHPVFCKITRGQVGGPVSASYVRHALKRLAKRAKIEKRVHAHGFRHTMASELVREGFDLTAIQAQLGHASAATTDRYLKRIVPERVIEAMRSRSAQVESTKPGPAQYVTVSTAQPTRTGGPLQEVEWISNPVPVAERKPAPRERNLEN